MTTTRTGAMRGLRTVLRAALLAALITGLLAGTALAKGKPGGGSTGSTGTSGLRVVMVSDQNANGAANWADWITFTFSTSNATPQINVTCSQNGSVVYSSAHLMYTPNYWDDDGIFWLKSGAWSGGAASCTAVLKGNNTRGGLVTLGSMSFSAGA